jgi:hypothetical protein
VISTELARALSDSGLEWHPRAGDAFRIDRIEVDDEVFILSDMTVEAHEFSTGTVLGFNGTTEWALDSVSIEDALWMPREDQLRELLGTAFHSLGTTPAGGFAVGTVIDAEPKMFEADTAADAYARALLTILDAGGTRPAR